MVILIIVVLVWFVVLVELPVVEFYLAYKCLLLCWLAFANNIVTDNSNKIFKVLLWIIF